MGMSVREILEHGDFEAFSATLAENIVWVGVLPGQLCRNREEVLDTFRHALSSGIEVSPEIVLEQGDLVVVDPHIQPPLERNPELHHVFVADGDVIVELRDFPDRVSALAAVSLAGER